MLQGKLVLPLAVGSENEMLEKLCWRHFGKYFLGDKRRFKRGDRFFYYFGLHWLVRHQDQSWSSWDERRKQPKNKGIVLRNAKQEAERF